MALLPLADRLHVAQLQSAQDLEQIYQTLLLIHDGEPSTMVEDKVHGRVA
jgi:hypothetical protein